MSVVQLIIADDGVIEPAATLEITGGLVVAGGVVALAVFEEAETLPAAS